MVRERSGVPRPLVPNALRAKHVWQNYFVFAIIRNPFGRAVSSYKYLDRLRTFNKTPPTPECRAPNFANFCHTPFILGMQTVKHGCKNHALRKVPTHYQIYKYHDYQHVDLQSPCLRTADGKLAVDYIVSLENMEEDWKGLARALQQRPGNSKESQDYFKRMAEKEVIHVNRDRSEKDSLLEECGQQCVDSLAAHYKDDIQFLGYDKCASTQF
eukprot:TRINITY_DN1719_c0_g2_i1.p3 TRINITY_DN1719_c0_g2~~TRINITY_DN1719_c0_g2_i1.p3  ORF type:complete len:213 (-),score=24.06 TRINITY_DN1719_c0_g2_i1:432-1070(-)